MSEPVQANSRPAPLQCAACVCFDILLQFVPVSSDELSRPLLVLLHVLLQLLFVTRRLRLRLFEQQVHHTGRACMAELLHYSPTGWSRLVAQRFGFGGRRECVEGVLCALLPLLVGLLLQLCDEVGRIDFDAALLVRL